MLVTGSARGRCESASSTCMVALDALVTHLNRNIFLTGLLAFVVEQEWEQTLLITASARRHGIIASQAII